MKKIFILIIVLFCLTGCYDNIELNDLSIITGIGIDYTNDNYQITYEVLNGNQTQDNSLLLSYTIKGEGKNIADAFINANYKVSKKAYFAHLKILVLSENIINGKLEDITDYLFRNTDIRYEFKIVVANNSTPEEILKHNSENHPVVSDLIENLLNNEKYNNDLAVNEPFQIIYAKLLNKNYDIILNSISIIEDEISLNNSYIFNGYNYKYTLNEQSSTLYNLLSKNVISTIFNKYYDNKPLSISINDSKTKIEVTKDEIKVFFNAEAKILENNPQFNLKEQSTYQKLNKDFANLIANNIKEFINILQQNKSDILGFQDIYYKKYNKENHNLWLNANVLVDVNLKINRKGLIFEVQNEK